ncbi:MAG: SMI1/KNR4 family protein [Planctomycetes bacterium]|nr:SMI1/KNR4 family protein [Planctomycetota bacterium]
MPVTPAEFCAARNTTRKTGATHQEICSVERSIGAALPPELRAFLAFSNGLSGFVGPEDNGWYIRIFSTTELLDVHAQPAIKDQWPELIQFGGNGAGEGFFFDPTRNGPPVLMIEYASDGHADHIAYASNMSEFFERMHTGFNPYRE